MPDQELQQLPPDTKEPHIQVSEAFGPTIQGEGPYIGRPCYFLRLHHCPTKCPGCDSFYTWDGSEKGERKTLSDIAAFFKKANTENPHAGLVLTGGEPLLHYKNTEFINVMKKFQGWQSLETSGFVGKTLTYNELKPFCKLFDSVSLSPKITPCLHGQFSFTRLTENVDTFLQVYQSELCDDLFFKFVVRDELDETAVMMFLDRYPEARRLHSVYLMPYGQERDEILRSCERIIPFAAKEGFIITPRLHSLIWGKERNR